LRAHESGELVGEAVGLAEELQRRLHDEHAILKFLDALLGLVKVANHPVAGVLDLLQLAVLAFLPAIHGASNSRLVGLVLSMMHLALTWARSPRIAMTRLHSARLMLSMRVSSKRWPIMSQRTKVKGSIEDMRICPSPLANER
jgi:hypothetical protein